MFALSLGEMTILKRLPDAYIKSFSLPSEHQRQWQQTYTILAGKSILSLSLFLVNVVRLAHKIRNTASYKICINGKKDVDISTYKFEDHGILSLFYLIFLFVFSSLYIYYVH